MLHTVWRSAVTSSVDFREHERTGEGGRGEEERKVAKKRERRASCFARKLLNYFSSPFLQLEGTSRRDIISRKTKSYIPASARKGSSFLSPSLTSFPSTGGCCCRFRFVAKVVAGVHMIE